MIERFLSYVEIRTKITSLFAFLMTLALLQYLKITINWKLSSLFFTSMFLFDLTTTAINNYIDTETNGQKLPFKRNTARIILFMLFCSSSMLGLYLAYLTDVVILLIGGICFLGGVFYTYGPVSISRQPLGEVLSGLFYGLLIPFILMYINMPKGTLLTLNLSWETVSVTLKIIPIATILLFAVVPFCVTADIMLANNICDLEKDIKVKRHTLPYYLGNKSLYLFAGSYYSAYLAILLMTILKLLPPLCLVTLLTGFIVQKNINTFFNVQQKETTFVLSIQNYILIMGTNTFMLFINTMFING